MGKRAEIPLEIVIERYESDGQASYSVKAIGYVADPVATNAIDREHKRVTVTLTYDKKKTLEELEADVMTLIKARWGF